MTNQYETKLKALKDSPRRWLITGVAGFIGSNLLEALLLNNQKVIGLDNFFTGYQHNLDEVRSLVGQRWSNFEFINGDIRDIGVCHKSCKGVDYVLHQAALGSVPRSVLDPITTNAVNIDGHLNMLVAARDANVESFTYAASSSTYGDHSALPKVEDVIGNPLSPYAITKYVNELYADIFARSYGFKSIGLRYFNVFGKRQDPQGAYAAVIPKWTESIIKNKAIQINGDGLTSRDFCYIENVVQANILAATASQEIKNNIFNIAVGEKTDLNSLFKCLKQELIYNGIRYNLDPEYRDFRVGDVRHSQADISKAKMMMGFDPAFSLAQGISEAMPWYIGSLS